MARIYSVDSAGVAPVSDVDLWELLRADPAAGLAQIYDRHSNLVYGLARRILVNERDAEDLTQEVFVSLLTRKDYDASRGSFVGFLATITRTRAIDRYRAVKRGRLVLGRVADEGDGAAAPAASVELCDSQQTQAVRAALATLPSAQRQVLELAYFRGLTQVQIAAEMEAPLGTVKSWTRSALSTLRELLGEQYDG